MKLEETKRTTRILEIVRIIATAPRRYLRRDLAQRFEVSERMIQKDLDVIRHGLRYLKSPSIWQLVAIVGMAKSLRSWYTGCKEIGDSWHLGVPFVNQRTSTFPNVLAAAPESKRYLTGRRTHGILLDAQT